MRSNHMSAKVISIVGARPQFIKAAMVSGRIRSRPGLEELLLHTGQHYDDNLSRVFFEELEIPEPDWNLGVGSGSHGYQTARMLEGIEGIILKEHPEMVLVYGDTNSTLAGALAAAKLHVPVAHVEAGLRSFNRRMPEEVNRVMADHLSDLLFAPTKKAVENLQKEGMAQENVLFVGDVMYDAALHFGNKAEMNGGIAARLALRKDEYILVTIHRAENTDDAERLTAVVEGLCDIAEEISVVWPLHPRTAAALSRLRLLEHAKRRLRVIDPVGYLDMCVLEKNANVIVTDSGGIQKEAFFHGVPCVTLRDETEWVELVELGWNRVARPTSASAIRRAVRSAEPPLPTAEMPYGNGDAADRIAQAVEQRLSNGPAPGA